MTNRPQNSIAHCTVCTHIPHISSYCPQAIWPKAKVTMHNIILRLDADQKQGGGVEEVECVKGMGASFVVSAILFYYVCYDQPSVGTGLPPGSFDAEILQGCSQIWDMVASGFWFGLGGFVGRIGVRERPPLWPQYYGQRDWIGDNTL